MDSLVEVQRRVIDNASVRGELDDWCRANWNRIPKQRRVACLNQLRAVLSTEAVQLMRAQHLLGLAIGSHVARFHFDYGMMVRNQLRHVLRDDELPAVEQPSGGLAQNWDDFYTGALEELAEEEIGYGQDVRNSGWWRKLWDTYRAVLAAAARRFSSGRYRP